MLSLINYSVYSMGFSTQSIKEIVSFAKQASMPLVALTDYHSLSGSSLFMKECHAAGIQGVVGVTLNIVDIAGSCGTVTLLPRDEKGYKQLVALLNQIGHAATQKGYNPKHGVQKDVFLTKEWHDACDRCVLLDGYPGSFAEQEVLSLSEKERTLGGVKASLQKPGTTLNTLYQLRPLGMYQAVFTPGAKNALALSCASLEKEVPNIPPVVNSLVSYSANQVSLVASQQMFRKYADKWLSSFQDPESAKKWVIEHFRGKSLPALSAMPQGLQAALPIEDVSAFYTPIVGGYSQKLKVDALPFVMIPETTLEQLVYQHWAERKRLIPAELVAEYEERLAHELDVIKTMGFENYFLNIYQFKQVANKVAVTTMLRGSAVSSLAMYVLEFMDVDPVKNELLFTRFLSEDRYGEPDVDIEFDDPKTLVPAITKEFGKNVAGALCSFGGVSKTRILLEMAKSAMLELYELSEQQIKDVESAYTKIAGPILNSRSPRVRDSAFKEWIEEDGKDVLKRFANDHTAMHLVDLARYMDKGYITVSQSVNSVIISPEGVDKEFAVLPSADGGMNSVAATKDSITGSGYIKYDLLSNRIFKRHILAMRSAGVPLDLEVSEFDRSIHYVFSNRALLGITQMGGWTSENLSKTVQPANLSEITAMFALMRDASNGIDNHTVEQYNKGRVSPVVLPGPILKFLKETSGVMLYEEQLLKILTQVADIPYREADRFRSGLKKGNYSVIDEYEPVFIRDVIAKHGVSEAEASSWYQSFRDKRGRFVFAKAHSLSYATLAVQQCWMKTYYPAHYAAELYADKSFTIRDNNYGKGKNKEAGQYTPDKLTSVVADWVLLHQGGWPSPENVKIFMNAIGKIAIREAQTPSDNYNFRLDSADKDIRIAIESGVFDPLFFEGDTRENLLQHWNKVLNRVAENLKNKTSVSQSFTRAAVKQNKQEYTADASTAQNPASSPAVGAPPEEEAKTLNQLMMEKDGEPWLEQVMFAQLLPYLHEIGEITLLSREKKSSDMDHFKFRLNTQGNEYYHICAMADDPLRLKADRKDKMNTGLYQGASASGRQFNKVTVPYFFREILEKGCFASLPRNKSNDFYNKEFQKIVLSKEIPLYGVHYLVPKTALRSPLFPVFPLSKNDPSFSKAEAEGRKALEGGRMLAPETVAEYVNSGNLIYTLRFANDLLESKFGRGGMYRKKYFGPVANYTKVESGRPLYEQPALTPGYFSEGGHQTIYLDESKGKVERPDHGTNAVHGHYFGIVKPGSDTLWVAEGMFDAMAFNEMQRWLPTLAPDRKVAEPNCIALKSTQNVKEFFEAVMGVRIITEKDGSINLQPFKEAYSVSPLNEETIRLYAQYLSSNQTVFLHDRTPESDRAFNVVRGLYNAVQCEGFLNEKARVNVIFCQESQWCNRLLNVYKTEGEKPGVDIYHKGNVQQFLRLNGMVVDENSPSPVIGQKIRERQPTGPSFNERSPDEQRKFAAELRERFMRMTGAKSLGLALDNDTAGIGEAEVLIKMCNLIGLPYVKHMPDVLSFQYTQAPNVEPLYVKDHNDYLKLMKNLINDGRYDELHQVIDHYTRDFQEQPGLKLVSETPALQHDIQNALKRK